MKRVFKWFSARFSLARLLAFIILGTLAGGVVILIGSQQIPDEKRLRPPPVNSFKPVAPKYYKAQ